MLQWKSWLRPVNTVNLLCALRVLDNSKATSISSLAAALWWARRRGHDSWSFSVVMLLVATTTFLPQLPLYLKGAQLADTIAAPRMATGWLGREGDGQ